VRIRNKQKRNKQKTATRTSARRSVPRPAPEQPSPTMFGGHDYRDWLKRHGALEEARRRIGDPGSIEAVRWLVTLAHTDLEKQTEEQWRLLEDELSAIAWDVRPRPAPNGVPEPPTLEETRTSLDAPPRERIARWRAHVADRLVFAAARRDNVWILSEMTVTPMLTYDSRERRWVGHLQPRPGTEMRGLDALLYEAIKAHGDALKVCAARDCHQPFLRARRDQIYCGDRCRVRTLVRKWRRSQDRGTGR